MPKPLIVSIPHQLGQQEAVRRLRSGFTQIRATFGERFAVIDETWSGEHLDFRVSVLGQATNGTIDVADDHVRLIVQLPWLLGMLAERAHGFIEKQGRLMLERKSTHDGGQTTDKR